MEQARKDATLQIDQLERKYKEMVHKLKDMHLKRMELMGRENVARTNQQINRVIHGNGQHAMNRFNELETFIEKIEKKVNQAYYESTFDQKIANLERELHETTANGMHEKGTSIS
jgi:phage shock protein A